MSKIAVDLDSTLYDFETPMRQAFFDLAVETGDEDYFKGAYASWDEWRSAADLCGFDAFKEALDRVHADEIILTRTPFEDAAKVLTSLYHEGCEFVYITARDEKCHDATEQWLSENFPQGSLICSHEDKVSQTFDCRYLIDDRTRTMVEFIYRSGEGGWEPGTRKVFGKMYQNNRNLTDIPGIYMAHTWAGIAYYLEREGVLHDRNGIGQPIGFGS